MSNIWPTVTIGDLFDFGAGKSVTPAARHGVPKHPFLRTSNVFWGRMDLSEVDSMHFTKDEISSKSLCKGDLLVCEGGDIGRAAIWNSELTDCSFQNHIHRLRAKHDNIIPHFYMYYLQSGFTQLGIYEGAGNKTTIPNLSRSRLSALSVPKPDETEQKKIAALLCKIQRAIQVEEKLTATARELKQAAMRQLFSHGLRGETLKETEVGQVPDSWNVCSIRANARLVAGGTPQRGDARYWNEGTIPWVKTGEMDYCVITETEEKITQSGLENSAAKLLPSGTVLVAMYGQGITRGKVAMLGIEATTNQACVGLIPKNDNVLPKYLYYYLTYSYERLRSLSHGAQQQNLNAELVGSFQVAFPNRDERPEKDKQLEIVGILSAIDHKIGVHERKHRALGELFQTLLHKLMTGEIRVADLDIDVSEVTQ